MPGTERDAELAPDRARQARRTDDHWLRCSVCEHAITPEIARIEIDGLHEHFQANAAGETFLFGCFGEAPGCRLSGQATDRFTWFEKHQWQFAVCGRCGWQLGWYFRSVTGGGFYGLILNRLSSD